jgi:hypothetical protein
MATTQKYVRPTVGGWLRPTLIAPWITTYGAVTAGVLLGFEWGGKAGKIAALTAGLLAGSVWSFVFCTFLVLIDLALLAVKIRTLPAGRRGWMAAFLSPLPALAVYTVLPWKQLALSGPWTVAGAILIPMAIVAIFSRVISGQKPPR